MTAEIPTLSTPRTLEVRSQSVVTGSRRRPRTSLPGSQSSCATALVCSTFAAVPLRRLPTSATLALRRLPARAPLGFGRLPTPATLSFGRLPTLPALGLGGLAANLAGGAGRARSSGRAHLRPDLVQHHSGLPVRLGLGRGELLGHLFLLRCLGPLPLPSQGLRQGLMGVR